MTIKRDLNRNEIVISQEAAKKLEKGSAHTKNC